MNSQRLTGLENRMQILQVFACNPKLGLGMTGFSGFRNLFRGHHHDLVAALRLQSGGYLRQRLDGFRQRTEDCLVNDSLVG